MKFLSASLLLLGGSSLLTSATPNHVLQQALFGSDPAGEAPDEADPHDGRPLHSMAVPILNDAQIPLGKFGCLGQDQIDGQWVRNAMQQSAVLSSMPVVSQCVTGPGGGLSGYPKLYTGYNYGQYQDLGYCKSMGVKTVWAEFPVLLSGKTWCANGKNWEQPGIYRAIFISYADDDDRTTSMFFCGLVFHPPGDDKNFNTCIPR